MRDIVRAGAWSGFRELVAELGGDPDQILAAARVEVALLREADRYMPLRAFIESQEIAARRLHRPDFGLLFGQRQSLSALGPLAVAITNAPTARQAIDLCARYLHLHNPATTMTLSPMPRSSLDFLSAAVELKRPIRCDQNSERILSSFDKSMRQIGGPAYRAREVWFTHLPLSPPSAYRAIFGVIPKFGRPAMGIAIERDVLDAWQPGRSAQLRQLSEGWLREMAPQRALTFTLRVAALVNNLLRSGECTPEQAAEALGIHPRTLQRRLKAEGASFEKIKDDVRRAMAEDLLAQPNVPLSEIAYMLHYADASAFSRSARRWFGESPRARRTRIVAGPPPAPRRPRPPPARARALRG